MENCLWWLSACLPPALCGCDTWSKASQLAQAHPSLQHPSPCKEQRDLPICCKYAHCTYSSHFSPVTQNKHSRIFNTTCSSWLFLLDYWLRSNLSVRVSHWQRKLTARGTPGTAVSCSHGIAEQSPSGGHAPGRFVLSLTTREQRLLFSQRSECGKQLVLHGLNNYWHCVTEKGFWIVSATRIIEWMDLFFFLPWALRIFSKYWLVKGPRETLGKKRIMQLKLCHS